MDYKEIINKGKLVYASRSTDSNFRLWRLNKTGLYDKSVLILESFSLM